MGLALDTEIPIKTKGRKKFKLASEVEVGDLLLNSQGRQTLVLIAAEPEQKSSGYRIMFSNGEVVTCDEDQYWLFRDAEKPVQSSFMPGSDYVKRRLVALKKADEYLSVLSVTPVAELTTRRITVDSSDRSYLVSRTRIPSSC